MILLIRYSCVFLCALCLSFSVNAAGGDDGLYSPSYPPGSAFVRFVNGDSMNSSPLTKIRGKSYANASLGEMGMAYAVSPGEAEIAFEDKASITHNLKPERRYIALLKNGKVRILEEPLNDDKIKTQIILINASDAEETILKTGDGKIHVIGPVAAAAIDARAVNPMKVGFSVYADGQKISNLQERPLERGPGYAVVVYKNASGKLSVHYDKARGF
jgi:hypothetical protein